TSVARIADNLPVYFSILNSFGFDGIIPSGGLNDVSFGTGIGSEIFVRGTRTMTIGVTPRSPSTRNVSASTFVCASMFTLSAGCGTPTFTSGPQYAMLLPGTGPG